jgi:4-diphosphocytidyl-2-C-methyl-D-erythritol kinase
MLLFPNAKINIGLNILSKREDGYHNIESLFYPIGLKDALEFVENHTDDVHLSLSGIPVDLEPQNNLIVKAYRLLASVVKLPGLDIHLHKAIPFGAGLGGGSSDAAFLLNALNDRFELNLSKDKLKTFALQLGADCSFFIDNRPSLASGIGEILTPAEVNLNGFYLLLVKPDFGVSTKEAYARTKPSIPAHCLSDSLKKDPLEWLGLIKNDFEFSVFQIYPQIAKIKSTLISNGAFFASMSGSGSSVFGLFISEPDLSGFNFQQDCFVWKELL